MQRLYCLCFLIFVGLGLCACTQLPWRHTLQIALRATNDANNGTATPVDIVFVYDENLAAWLPKTSTEWFAKKAALMSEHSSVIEIAHVEVPPGTPVQTIRLPARHQEAKAVMAFANYIDSKGQFPANLMSLKCVTITLKHDTVAYDACR